MTRYSIDGAPNDGVGHDFATPDVLAQYKDAADQLSRLRAPILVHADRLHEKMFLVAFDGTGNNKYSDPAHGTNVARIDDELEEINRFGRAQVLSHYVVGPGTKGDILTSAHDSISGSSYESNIANAYEELVRQTNQWLRDDPASVIRVHSIGFSRGASQVPGFARLLHEKGIPDLDSEITSPDGTFSYAKHLVEPGKTVQTVGLFDPVATGVPMQFDRRLPPSVVSGFQITAADELRALFPSDQIIPPGLSADGRFLNVMVPGSHSDVGGGYLRDGLSIRCGNLMRDYCNALRDEPYLQKEFEPTDRRLNVIHRSTEGSVVFRLDPRESVRGEPSGTNTELVPRRVASAGLPPSHATDMTGNHGLDWKSVETGHAGTRSSRAAYPAATLDEMRAAGKSVPFAPRAVTWTAGAAMAADTVVTLDKTKTQLNSGNVPAAQSALFHFGGRNLAGIAGAQSLMSAGAALGIESGPGMFVTGAIGGVAGFVAGDKIADAYDQYRIRNQSDSHGNTWHHDDRQGWTIDVPPLPDHPRGQRLVADAALSSQLSYQASNTAVELALGNDYPARDPFVQPASPNDTPSLREAPWTHQAQTHQWTRQVTDQRLEHGMTRSHVEVANPQRAAELDRLAERTIQQNVAESPLGVAQRYQLAYEREGWSRHGPMPEAVVHAVARPADQILASDGHTYTHGRDREWSRDTLLGTRSADENLREELDASERVAQGLKKGVDTAALDHPSVAPAVPTRLDDPNHPDHALFKEIRGHVVELDKSLNRSPDQYTDNIASALTVQARADGLSHVDRIALSTDGKALWASQTPAGRKDHVFDLTTKVPTAEANTPLEQSGAKWPEAMQQFQGHQQELAQTQQRSLERTQAENQAQSVSGPVMRM
ncbi:hypothetical protein J2T07_003771 [Luteibacter jiangsuensis]|uniref:Alpha/beta hydrolase family protein DUF2235 n=1 Tax=Luteibacter jiangsuensis TaxID=637577 RepID=A0ABT9T5Z5_9GAMM|nr:DUF2235 domain-containing protein [Luteibacter jiangsuensis]MDQ0011557.1 hypothetical protein [Luteibacter jiangsuensis]